jgi:hypothetical protein
MLFHEEEIGSSAAAGTAARSAFVSWLGHDAEFFGQTVRVLGGEMQDDRCFGDLSALDGILGDDAVFIFDLDRDLWIGQEKGGLAQDAGEFATGDPVIFITADPGLKLAAFCLMKLSTAVDEGLFHMPDFRDVKGDGHGAAAGQSELKSFVGVL